jgi:YVTN family beta-propeller protein
VKRLATLATVLVFGLTLTACAQTGTNTGSANGIYASDIQPILTAKCSSCHSGERKDAGLDLSSWEVLIKGSDHGEAIIAFDAENSVLVKMATKLIGGAHPGEAGSPTLSEAELTTISNWINGGAIGPDGNPPFSGNRDFVYVTNQGEGTVNVIDTEANVVARRVDLTKMGFDKGSKPHHVAVEADGSYWYATLISANRVLKFNYDNELVGSLEFEVPGLLEMDPTSSRMIVGRSMAAVNPPQRIGLFDRDTMEMEEELEVFMPRPHAVAFGQDGTHVYAASLAENKLIAIDLETGDSELHDIEGPIHTLVELQIAPDGKSMVTGGQLTGKFFFLDSEDKDGVPVEKVIDVEAAPWHPIFNRAGTRAYFANKMADKVTILNMETMEVEAVIEGNGLAQPHGAGLSADERYLYVSNQNQNMVYSARHLYGDSQHDQHPGTVSVIDLTTNQIVKVLEVGQLPAGTTGRPTW